MKQKLLSLVVTLVTMFGGLGSVQAQEYTVTLNQSSNKAFTGENGGVKFSITNLGNWEGAGGIIGDRHYAGYEVASETNSVISWEVPSNHRIKLSKVEVKATAASGTARKRNIDLYTSKSTDANCVSVACNGGFNEAKTLTLSDYNEYFDGIGNDGTITIQHGTQNMYIYSIEIKYELEVEANLTINPQAEYGTFVAPFQVTLPEGVTAYTIASTTGTPTEDGVANFTAIEGNILPACTPVVVYKAGGQETVIYKGIPTTTDETVEGANGLVGVLADGKTAPVNSYVINYINNHTAFYIVGSESTISVAKNRCYIAPAAAASAKLNFSFGNPTAVTSVNANATVSAIYNAAGARISAAQKGMNIIKYSDGSVKKVLVK